VLKKPPGEGFSAPPLHLLSGKSFYPHNKSRYAPAYLLFVLSDKKGLEGSVVNDSPVDCQSRPPLHLLSGKSGQTHNRKEVAH